ncbi:MAG TPA: polymer-forming cytoskeletal protein [Nitrolancea sp.]|nr:polymer-forming cytoskeletal protein [Nitrolancea sp.]
MTAKPIPAFWRGAFSSSSDSRGRTERFSDWIARTWNWRPSILAKWRGEYLSRFQSVTVDSRETSRDDASAPAAETTRAGGMLMIFRKDSRGESFQRQVSGLRKQAQSDDELGSDEFRYDETHDTSQFATTPSTPAAPRDETFTSSRIGTDTPQTQSIASVQPAYRPTWQSADATTSVVAVNANWNGTLRTEGSIHLHGKAEGELHAASDVFVAEGAEVDAHIFADNVVVAGIVRGRIEARGRLELLPQGHVSGDVKAPRLIVHEGAQLSGQLKMDAGSTTPTYSTEAATPKERRSAR